MKKSINPKYDKIIDIVITAGKISLNYFQIGKNIAHQIKKDNSAVTKADLEVNQYLTDSLNKAYPDIKVISEENDSKENALEILSKKVFIIDPIDGTSSFIKGSQEFTINLALKIDKDLVLGIIYSPFDDILYYADSEFGVFKISDASRDFGIEKLIKNNSEDKKDITIIVTRRQDEVEEIKKMLVDIKKPINFLNISSSVKFCLLCEGKADAYYRAARIKIWDVAAGFAIVKLFGFQIFGHQNQNLLDIIFEENYVKNFLQNDFRIEPFIVKFE